MPPTPSASSLTGMHTLLSSLRSEIFQTSHNPSAVRTGTKYLRRRLVGPSAVRYYPRMPKLTTLNAMVPWNGYGNWQGEASGSYRERVAASGSGGQKVAWAKTDGSSPAGTATATATATGAEEQEGESSERGVRWATAGDVLLGSQVVPEGWTEVTRIRGAGWVDDAAERVRVEEVDQKRAAGRGPPKKGEGKRSQMGKKKK